MSSPASGSAAPSAGPAVSRIRTLALVGPAAAGKTTLAEALLQQAGMIGAAGSVERGSTVSDSDALERRMQHSLVTSVLHLNHADHLVHLLDTPGSTDCLGQSLPALEAVETAAVVVNATTGIEPMAASTAIDWPGTSLSATPVSVARAMKVPEVASTASSTKSTVPVKVSVAPSGVTDTLIGLPAARAVRTRAASLSDRAKLA